MKLLTSAIAILYLLISPLNAFAHNAFITTCQISSANESITMPTNGGWAITDGGLPSSTAPTTADTDLFAAQDTPWFSITTSDIPYNDGNGDPLAELHVTSIPATGTFGIDVNNDGELSGSEILASNDIISRADLDNPGLTWVPPTGVSGYRVDSFDFNVSDGAANSADATIYLTLKATEVSLPGTAGQNGWHLLANPWDSSPSELLANIWTQGATGGDTPSGTSNVYAFNEPTTSYDPLADLTQPLSDGQGLAVYVYVDDDFDGAADPWPKTLSASGNALEAPVDITVTNTESQGPPGLSGDEGWNLIGNPFGTPVAVDSVIAGLEDAGASPNNSVYIWDKTQQSGNGDWVALSQGTDAEVAAYQAMFIRMQSFFRETATLTLENDDRSTGSPPIFKDPQPHNSGELHLALTEEAGGLQQTAAIQFGESASQGLDPDDIYWLRPLSEQFLGLYSKVGDQALKVNNMSLPASKAVAIPLAAEATTPGVMTLTWERRELPDDLYLMLTDTETGDEVLLHRAASYTFTFSDEAVARQKDPGNTESLVSAQAHTGQSRFILTMQRGAAFSPGNPPGEVPSVFELKQNVPNPFNPNTRIAYALPEAADVTLKVFDVAGREVATLVNQTQTVGNYTVTWDASGLASGLYIYRLITGQQIITKKMMLIK